MARRSKVDALPPELRAALDRWLADAHFGGYAGAAALLNAELAQRGSALRVSCSGVHRYGQKLERRLEQVRAATEAARQIAVCTEDREDHRSAAVIAMIQAQAFDVMLDLGAAESEEDREARLVLLTKAARGMADMVRASLSTKKHQQEVAERLKTMEGEARAGKRALDAETLRIVREEIYGIV